jgi:hypothetical protein
MHPTSVGMFIKHTLKDLTAYIDSNTVVVGDLHTHAYCSIIHNSQAIETAQMGHQQIGHPNKKSIKKF